MIVRILGSGTSTGVPVIGCDCKICSSTDEKNKRLRASIAVYGKDKDCPIIIDTGPDFRQQVLNAKIKRVKAILFTHLHADHIMGFDDLRAFYFYNKDPITCYLASEYIEELKSKFSYAFEDTGYKGVTPKVELESFQESAFQLGEFNIEARAFEHGVVKSYGFKIDDFCYVTDFKRFTAQDIKDWKGKIKVMVASGIHFREHFSHSVVPETIQLFKELGVQRGILSHLSHEIDYQRDKHKLPENVEFAYDGMEINI